MNHDTKPFPHEGGCLQCREQRACNACGRPLDKDHCTNGRCGACHRAKCGFGGTTSRGHGFYREVA